MKLGIRTPSLKKSLSAKTTGKLKRSVKASINPFYGKKGIGTITNPQKSLYNKVYNQTTFNGFSSIKNSFSSNEEREWVSVRLNRECLTLEKNGNIIYAPLGFEQGVVFGGALVPLLRKDYVNFLKILLLQIFFFKGAGFGGGLFFSIFINIVCSFIYNKMYLKQLYKKGYKIIQ